jgi:hypothetical protein
MIEHSTTIRAGLVKRLHVDQHRIKHNTKTGDDLPVLTVQAQGGPYKAHEVEILGPSRLVYDGRTLSCGAKVWIECDAEVVLTVRDDAAEQVA